MRALFVAAPILAQRLLERAEDRDKRLLLFDGEPVGAVNRIPLDRDYRGNLHVCARGEAAALDAADVEICRILRPHLKRWGLSFVGIDVIEGHLTEINVTSPTGILEIDALDGVRLDADLVDLAERHALARAAEEA